MSDGVSKMRVFLYMYFSVSCSQTSSCASKPLTLRYRYVFYEVLLQVSVGLKENEKDRQGAKCQRGVQNAVLNISVLVQQLRSCRDGEFS